YLNRVPYPIGWQALDHRHYRQTTYPYYRQQHQSYESLGCDLDTHNPMLRWRSLHKQAFANSSEYCSQAVYNSAVAVFEQGHYSDCYYLRLLVRLAII